MTKIGVRRTIRNTRLRLRVVSSMRVSPVTYNNLGHCHTLFDLCCADGKVLALLTYTYDPTHKHRAGASRAGTLPSALHRVWVIEIKL